MKIKKGQFIVIDGNDGSGKATQTELLMQRLKKEKVKVKKIDFPQYTKNVFGKLLFEALKEGKHGNFIDVSPKIASAIYAADRFESSGMIRKWLEQGYTIISDRYVSANQIHQGGKIRDEASRKDFVKWLETIEFKIFKIPKPDVIVYLHVPLEVSLELIRTRALERKEKVDQAESDAKYLFESHANALKIIEQNNKWVKIDCVTNGSMRNKEDIHEEIAKKLKKYIGRK